MQRQQTLWDQPPPAPVVADPSVTAEEAPRLERLALAILAAYQAAPDKKLTNVELTRIGGLRFGARQHELKRAGHVIKIVKREMDTGLVTYQYQGHDPR